MSLLDRLEKNKAANQPEVAAPVKEQQKTEPVRNATPQPDPQADLRKQIQREVIDVINQNLSFEEGDAKNEYIRNAIETVLTSHTKEISRSERGRWATELYNDIVGLGPIEPLLADPDITEIMVNGPDLVYVEVKGKIQLTDVKFRDNEHVMNVINRIVTSIGRRIDESSPMVDARLEDGSRVNAVIPPVALSGPTITIRKFSKNPLTVGDLMRFGSATPQMFSFLEACVKAKLNIVVSGGTGSGKTTLLSVLSAYIPENERIVTIEDAAELQLRQQHVITLESKPANVEGKGAVTIRDLVRNALRMRPDRIVVGEVRSGEALDMLQAMNTGHDGSLTTGHANSPRDMMSRLETMVLMSGMEMPVKAIREQISSALDLVVQQSRLRDGTRKIVSISEVVGMEGDTITLQDIFVYKPPGVDGDRGGFYPTGVRPNFLDKMIGNGVPIREEWFQK
ncbi:MAG: CpaF family protein [Erysipelotrichaceae bacterium]|mgnify:CR=1 FL=1|nr:CpaF family protein [Erysipelotrichaceae bacterium]